MILRIWRSGYIHSKLTELENFAASHSGPMFRQQEGCLGYFFAVKDGEWLTITLWRDETAIMKMENSMRYQETVRQILATGTLSGPQTTQTYPVIEQWQLPQSMGSCPQS